jgi:hypothetical protein
LDNLRVATEFTSIRSVPEPSPAALLLLGGLGWLCVRRRA